MRWNGCEVKKRLDESVDERIVREMLWELFEMSFQVKLQVLDKELVKVTNLDTILNWQVICLKIDVYTSQCWHVSWMIGGPPIIGGEPRWWSKQIFRKF